MTLSNGLPQSVV